MFAALSFIISVYLNPIAHPFLGTVKDTTKPGFSQVFFEDFGKTQFHISFCKKISIDVAVVRHNKIYFGREANNVFVLGFRLVLQQSDYYLKNWRKPRKHAKELNSHTNSKK